jgi:uncharacterized protein
MRKFRFMMFMLVGIGLVMGGCARPTPAPIPPPLEAARPPSLISHGGRIDLGKQFLEMLVSEDYPGAVAWFNPKMKEALSEAKLTDTWTKLLSQVGQFEEVTGSMTERIQEYERITLTCRFQKDSIDVRVVFDEDDLVAGLFFAPATTAIAPWSPPDYVDRGKFDEVEAVIGSGDWALPGTLSLPKGIGPFPAVVLVHGSGPNDRDETIYSNKPFRDLAWGLASQDIAVLRYDKRTLVHANKLGNLVDSLTVYEETVEDALLAVEALRKIDKIDNDRIYVLGHSLGGMLVPQIGAGDEDIAGFIILAGGARPLEDMVLEQVTYIFNLDGPPDEDQEAMLDEIREQVQRIKEPNLSASTPASNLLEIPAAYWLDLRGYDPPEQAVSLERPTLVLQGGRDYQVTEVDFQRWQRYLGNTDWADFKLYPDLNHLFISGEGVITPAEYMQPGNVSKEVVDDIARWIIEQQQR